MSTDPGSFPVELHVEVEEIATPAPEVPARWSLRTVLALCALTALVGWASLARGGPSAIPFVERQPMEEGQALYTALRLVGVEPSTADYLPGVWWGPVLTSGTVNTFGNDGIPLSPGRYELKAACVGRGPARIYWQTNTSAYGEMNLDCTTDGDLAADAIVLSSQAAVTVAVGTAEVHDSRASFAVALTDPRIVAATHALGPSGATTVLSGADVSLGFQSEFGDIEPGDYEITLVCVGTGRLQVAMWLGATQAPRRGTGENARELPCTLDGERLEVDLSSAEVATFVMMVLEIGGPPGSSGFAFRMDRSTGPS